MTTRVSLQRQSEQPAKLHEEKNGFAKRVSSQSDRQKAFAIAALFFLPGAVGCVMPKTTPVPGLQISNATCPLLQVSAQEINTYVTAGSASYFSSGAARQAEALRLEDFNGKPWRLEEKKFQLLTQAAEDILTQTENEDSPAARAVGFHQAREVLELAEALPDGKFNRHIEERVKILRVNEADACNLAAGPTDTPGQRLEWVARGLKELKISSDPHTDYSCLFDDNLPLCAAAASLWLTAARAFQELPSHETRYPYSIVPYQFHKDLLSRAPIAAARCLYNAAYCASSLGNDKEALDLLNKAIELMKSMDTTGCTLLERTELQEEIVSTCIAARNFSPNKTDPALSARIYSEAMTAQEMYLQLIEAKDDRMVYYTIKRALKLEEAAYFSPHLTLSAMLYKEARDIVQKVWDLNPSRCRSIPDFANEKYSISEPSFTLENSLLGRLRMLTNQAEKKIERENAGLLRSAWNWLWASQPLA